MSRRKAVAEAQSALPGVRQGVAKPTKRKPAPAPAPAVDKRPYVLTRRAWSAADREYQARLQAHWDQGVRGDLEKHELAHQAYLRRAARNDQLQAEMIGLPAGSATLSCVIESFTHDLPRCAHCGAQHDLVSTYPTREDRPTWMTRRTCRCERPTIRPLPRIKLPLALVHPLRPRTLTLRMFKRIAELNARVRRMMEFGSRSPQTP